MIQFLIYVLVLVTGVPGNDMSEQLEYVVATGNCSMILNIDRKLQAFDHAEIMVVPTNIVSTLISQVNRRKEELGCEETKSKHKRQAPGQTVGDQCLVDSQGDGWCDIACNNQHSNWDGGDCCQQTCKSSAPFPCGSGGYHCLQNGSHTTQNPKHNVSHPNPNDGILSRNMNIQIQSQIQNHNPSPDQNSNPPANQNYYPPPNQNSYPPPNQNYETPTNQNYNPPSNQNYQPPPNQNYNPPPDQNNYSPPNQNYYPPPNQNYYPPPNQNYVYPPPNQNYNLPPNYNPINYNPNNYNPNSNTHNQAINPSDNGPDATWNPPHQAETTTYISTTTTPTTTKPDWFTNNVQLCMGINYNWDVNQCSVQPGTVNGFMCAKVGQYTGWYTDYTDDRPGGCFYKWHISSPSNAPGWFNEIEICFKARADGIAGQCSDGKPLETCARVNSDTRPYYDNTDGRGGGCFMSWMIKLPPSTEWWAKKMMICFKWEPYGEAPGAQSQCGKPGTAQVLCASDRTWTPEYWDDTDNRNGGCRMAFMLKLE